MTEPEHSMPNAANTDEPNFYEQEHISSPEDVPGPESRPVEHDAPISSPEDVAGPDRSAVEHDAESMGAHNPAAATGGEEDTTTGESDLASRAADASWF